MASVMTSKVTLRSGPEFVHFVPALCGDQVGRDGNGRIITIISDRANGRTNRDANGKIIGRMNLTCR
jgi:hypothetical protein